MCKVREMKVLVCGGRNFDDYDLVYKTLGEIDHEHWDGVHISEIIHGAAKGADSLAARWAKEMGVPVIAFPADWKSWGNSAGPIRNSQMLEHGCPDLVVAFPGGRGTADMIGKARLKGIEIIEVPASTDKPLPESTK